MHPFEYLSILVYVIIGLGIKHLISGGARLIHQRDRIPVYLPTVLWMVFLFLLQIQIWWVGFYRRGITDWNFFGFLLYLLIPIGACLLGYLLIPESEKDENPEQVYYHNRIYFFGAGIAITIISLTEDYVSSGRTSFDLNFLLRIMFLILFMIGLISPKKLVHQILAPVALVILVFYIAVLFSKLG